MVFLRWILSIAALLSGFTLRAGTEGGSRWRVYTVADGLDGSPVVSVNSSPRGNVWVKHSTGPIDWLDGFHVRNIPFSGGGIFPVYESRSGQIWSVYSDGVMEYRRERDQWVQYPIAEIRAENQSSSLRSLGVRPIVLLPAERDHLLAVLPDRLLEFDVGQGRTGVIRWARDTELGRFNEIVEARDGGAWLTGSNGLAKLPGPVRRLSAQSVWQQFPLQSGWGVQNLERPFEDDDGGVTVAAASFTNDRRVALYFNGQAWEKPVPAPEKTRYAWRGSNGAIWAVTPGALFKREASDWVSVRIPGLNTPQFYDVATEPNGVFWLATTEGLVRHSLQTWRAPHELATVNTPVHAISEDRGGGLWFADTNRLTTVRDGQLRSFEWPDGFSPSFESPTPLVNSPDGQIAVNSDGGPLFFNPKTGGFSPLFDLDGRHARVIGAFRDGRLCVVTAEKGVAGRFRLETFDGNHLELFFEPKPDWILGDEPVFLRTTEGGAMWLGTRIGLALWDNKTKTFIPDKNAPQGHAIDLLETAKGRIWYATKDVIAEFNGKTWSVLHAASGRIHAIREARDGSIWVAHAGGLDRFTDGSWVANSSEEGLVGKQVYDIFQDRRGGIWAATDEGVRLYHRSADVDPPVSSFGAGENPNEVYSTDTLTLKYRGRDKWDCTVPERLLFSHRLDETPWSPYLPATSAAYSDLAAGKHRIAVRAMDRNWNEEPEPSVYEFVSVVPWFHEPRLLAITALGTIVTVLLAWLAVNRHFRLLRSYAEVEKIVAQRTRELERANQELLHSQKMRALGTLAAGIAHDFNSILSIIKGSVQIVETNLGDREKVMTRVERIKTMVEQGSGIVRAMLGFSRTGQEEKWCDANELVAETKKLLGDQFQHGIVLRLDPAPILPRIKAVGELIQQILMNLVLNAADAMGGKPGEIILRTGLIEQAPQNPVLPPLGGPPYVSISVKDHGCGIAAEILPRIFEPFYTTKAFSTRRGTGLGLSMVYEIAKETGYGLMVESLPNEGSTFTVFVPVPREPETGAAGT